MKIAQIILQQLGGNKFLSMTGASNLVSSSYALSFSIPRNESKANRIVISLTENDLYKVEFWKVSVTRGTVKVLNSFEGIYCDTLKEILSSKTGMALSL